MTGPLLDPRGVGGWVPLESSTLACRQLKQATISNFLQLVGPSFIPLHPASCCPPSTELPQRLRKYTTPWISVPWTDSIREKAKLRSTILYAPAGDYPLRCWRGSVPSGPNTPPASAKFNEGMQGNECKGCRGCNGMNAREHGPLGCRRCPCTEQRMPQI